MGAADSGGEAGFLAEQHPYDRPVSVGPGGKHGRRRLHAEHVLHDRLQAVAEAGIMLAAKRQPTMVTRRLDDAGRWPLLAHLARMAEQP